MPSVGAEIARFDLMGTAIALQDGKLVTDKGTLAGAHLDMASAVRNAVELAEIRLEHALTAAAHTPARFLGLEDKHGVIAPGARADLVALTQNLRVLSMWMGGVRETEN
jgi:N-acetylglucosamine-6-phosphate deacetylase